MSKMPSELHAALTNDRIDLVGQLIASARAESLDLADERDSGWCLGCRAYDWIRSEITLLAEYTDWVKIVNPSLKFIFTIGNVEVSVYKGSPSKPKDNIRNRIQSHPEVRQISLFSDVVFPAKLVWAFAVETDAEGVTTNIEFLGMDEAGDVIASRAIPLHSVHGRLVPAGTPESEPVELPPAHVSLPKVKEQRIEDDEKE